MVDLRKMAVVKNGSPFGFISRRQMEAISAGRWRCQLSWYSCSWQQWFTEYVEALQKHGLKTKHCQLLIEICV